jgi:glycosyltransferase involved in cell wall biosynthesis
LTEELVSVLLPVHKDNPYLEMAIQSLLEQTYTNVEILFLDNSQKGLPEKIWNKSKIIRHIKISGNFGLSETLNAGIAESRGEFILRMDYDDICTPNRIHEQVKYMKEHPEIGVCGSFAEVIGINIDSNVKPGEIIKRPTEPDSIIEYLLYKNPFLHPTVLMRRSMITRYGLQYRKKFDSAEDLDLWARCARNFGLGNIASPLIQYRIHESQYSRIDGINSQLQSAVIRRGHAAWVIVHKKHLRKKALKAFIKNSIKVLRLKHAVLFQDSFKKFD